jgi:hypothetical protein
MPSLSYSSELNQLPYPALVVMSAHPFSRLTSPSDYTQLLEKYDTWMFDCDGVLWTGDRLIDGAKEVLSILRKHSASKPTYFQELQC